MNASDRAQQYASKITPDMPQPISSMPIGFMCCGLTPTHDDRSRDVQVKSAYKDRLTPQVAMPMNATNIISKMCAFKPTEADNPTPVEQLASKLGLFGGHRDLTQEDIDKYEADIKAGKAKRIYLMSAITDEMRTPQMTEKPKVKVQTPEDITAMIKEVV